MTYIKNMTYTSPIIRAPFDKEQLAALQKRQKNEKTNRYICPEHGSNDHFVLEATVDGLRCPECMTMREWATREVWDDKKKKQPSRGVDKPAASPAAEE
jgi:transcription initiation factor IIE alpha subunit